MNIKEYIESGVLEAYILNALSPEEKTQVENDIEKYPELAEELKSIEEGMFAFAKALSEEPSAHLKEQIWNIISNQNLEKNNHKENISNIRPFTQQPSADKIGWQRAAVWLLLIGSVLLNIFLWSQRNNLVEDRTALNQQTDSLKAQHQELSLAMENYAKEKEMLADTSMQSIVMKSMLPGHRMAASVYWNKLQGDTYLSFHKMPMPPQGKQYQMWVIQNGVPVSMGVIPNEVIEKGMMTKLPMQIMEGQAFAISLEKEGGNDTPTEVQVLGKIS